MFLSLQIDINNTPAFELAEVTRSDGGKGTKLKQNKKMDSVTYTEREVLKSVKFSDIKAELLLICKAFKLGNLRSFGTEGVQKAGKDWYVKSHFTAENDPNHTYDHFYLVKKHP